MRRYKRGTLLYHDEVLFSCYFFYISMVGSNRITDPSSSSTLKIEGARVKSDFLKPQIFILNGILPSLIHLLALSKKISKVIKCMEIIYNF